ncbi:hypothetical protein [Dickeya poaceiphila]|uniref:Uncharacterized protein n=1 Tax=Dickeya poaceiphila TaxID=568768 RepID=A0A5B8I7J4_9GAMM|nr:hypothetical protein [Dickeya poaceiphila]QDX29868.1 hypothetical protein Dpoa569_0001694 [Dickeya poaceiphila]
MPKPSTTPNAGPTATQRNNAQDNSIFSPLRDNVYLSKINSVLQDFLSKAGQISHGDAFNAVGAPKNNRTSRKKSGRLSAAAQLGMLGNLARRFDVLTAALNPASSALKNAHALSGTDNAGFSRSGQSPGSGVTQSLIAQASDGVNSIYLSAAAAMQAQQHIAGLVPSARLAGGAAAPSLPGNVAALLNAQQSLNLPTNLLPQPGATSQTGAEGLNALTGTAQESFVGMEETSMMLTALSYADLDDGDGGADFQGGLENLQALSGSAMQLLSQPGLTSQNSVENHASLQSDMTNGHYSALSPNASQQYFDQRVVNNITITVPENSNLDVIKQYIEEALRKYSPNSSAYSYNSMTSNLIS